MAWRKIGLLFEPLGAPDWMASHAALPFALPLEQGGVRVYFSARDREGRSRIGSFDVDPEREWKVTAVRETPCLELGALGTFDDRGLTNSWLTEHEGRQYLYYSGWSLGVTVPFYFYVGLGISEDGGRTFRRASEAPVLERDAVDPYLTASPCILVEEGVWRMWYVAGTGWTADEGQPKHYYHIRYAESADGVRWRREGTVCIDYAGPDEYAIARPCVIRDPDCYRMWYCCRGDAYRIGYAESPDGLRWTRKDEEAGLDVSSEGWDSEMLAYPHVFDYRGRRYMLYNGNGYGRSGIGLAVEEREPAGSGGQ